MASNRIRATADVLPPAERKTTPNLAFQIRPRLRTLREVLDRVHAAGHASEPAPLFFFHKHRQAELEASREIPQPFSECRNSLTMCVEELWPALVENPEVRHAARALPGLREAAAAVASLHPAARDVHDLLAVLDDEVLCILEPATRAGFTLEVHGLADIGQIHGLLTRVHPASRSEAREYQFFSPSGLRGDGTLPGGPAGSPHWLFNEQPATSLPRRDGERVVLLGEPLPTARTGGETRFAGLRAQARLIRSLSFTEVLDRLSRWTGQRIVDTPATTPQTSRAA